MIMAKGETNLPVGIVARLNAGIVRDGFGNTDRLFNIEIVEATRFSDSLVGNSLANQFNPYFGSDYVDGGTGTDTVSYEFDYNLGLSNELIRRPGLDADLALGTIIDLGGRADTILRIENVIGSQLNDQIKGNALGNVLNGLEGDDVLNGRNGNDTCSGEFGQDRLFGGAGNDTLSGGRGDDYLHGGANIDTFVFAEIADYDVIRDFATGVDKIDVSDYGFASGAAVLALAVQRGASVIIALNADSIVELANTSLAGGLAATDFIV
jgi:Ca2+-binding RTX toxin-like protein